MIHLSGIKSISPTVCLYLSYLFKASTILCSFAANLSWCLVHFTCWSMTLFFSDTSSLLTVQNSLPAETTKLCSWFCLMRSKGFTFFGPAAVPPLHHLVPVGAVKLVCILLFHARDDGAGQRSVFKSDGPWNSVSEAASVLILELLSLLCSDLYLILYWHNYLMLSPTYYPQLCKHNFSSWPNTHHGRSCTLSLLGTHSISSQLY